MRRRFLRRVGLAVAFFFGLMIAANALAVLVLARAFRVGHHRGFVPAGAILGLVLLAGFVAVGRTVRRVAAPVGDVMDAADRVASGDYTARVSERGPREMRRLARSFNAMAQRLEAGERERRNLLADLAHELRTPLSVIQGNAEGMLDGLYEADRAHLEPVLEETRIMARLLDDLQTLSTAEAGALRLYRELVDPGQLVADAAAAFRAGAASARVGLEQRVAPRMPGIDVDPVRIGEVLANLLQNALRHTPPGGSVTIKAEPAESGRAVEFSVEDTGLRIPPEALPHVFDRFMKAADSGGSGLGLAIAKSLVQAHGGRIAADSGPGRGARVRFVLPAREDPARRP